MADNTLKIEPHIKSVVQFFEKYDWIKGESVEEWKGEVCGACLGMAIDLVYPDTDIKREIRRRVAELLPNHKPFAYGKDALGQIIEFNDNYANSKEEILEFCKKANI